MPAGFPFQVTPQELTAFKAATTGVPATNAMVIGMTKLVDSRAVTSLRKALA
jgi:hypothetical protein